MEKVRGFEVAKGFEDKGINLPVRKTKCSAGYDVEAAEDVIIPSFKPGMKPTLVKTGIKSYFNDDEVLLIVIRSSMGFKYNIRLCNQVGVIDSDYYNNQDNEGHIWIRIQNEGNDTVKFNKGEALVQGIFIKYLTTKSDEILNLERRSDL